MFMGQQNHKWVRSAGTSSDDVVHLALPRQDQLEQVPQDHVQLDF